LSDKETAAMDDDFKFASPKLQLLLKSTTKSLTAKFNNHTQVNTSFMKKEASIRIDKAAPSTNAGVQKEDAATRRIEEFVPPFNQSDISRLSRNPHSERLHLLLFDGHDFKILGLGKDPRYCNCQRHFMALIIDGLLTARRQRFRNKSAPFQVLVSTMYDNVYYNCVDDVVGCSQENYPPLLTPTSVPKNSSASTFLKQVPIPNYNKCLYHWRRNETTTNHCVVREAVSTHRNTSEAWDTLEPQLFWRGSDLGYVMFRTMKPCNYVLPRNQSNCGLSKRQAADILLREPNLQPRCRAVALTLDLEANLSSSKKTQRRANGTIGENKLELLPWINVKFFNDSREADWQTCGQTVAPYTSPKEMAKYKYQIDFSGIGGTTWLGTISKLAMPGVLFHHDAPTKDWFHDDIQPWVHYIPVNMNLSNLEDMFRWAESHHEQAKQIAQRAQDFAREQVTHRVYQATFDKLYVQVLGRIADAYRPAPNETLESILEGYHADGLFVTELGTCNENGCQVKPEYSD
jgi:hypothetical protein